MVRSSNSKPPVMGVLVPSPVAYDECKTCGFVGPVEVFRKAGICDVCYASKKSGEPVVMEPTATAQQKEAVKAVDSLIRTVKRVKQGAEAPGVAEVVNCMLEQFGGMQQFVQSWHSTLVQAKVRDPGGTKVLRAHEQIAKLISDANRLKVQSESPTTMSDEEIRDELLALIQAEIESSANPRELPAG